MDRGKVITKLLTNELKAYAFKQSKGNDLWNDCLSEMVLCLYDMDEDRFKRLSESGEITPYCYKIIYLSFNSPTSPFYKKYIKAEQSDEFLGQELFEYDEINVDEIKGFISSLEVEISKKRFPAEVRLFELYCELGSYRAVAKKVNLPVMTCFYIIEGFKTEIKKKL